MSLRKQLAEAKAKSAEPVVLQFQNASVVITDEFSLATGRRMYKLYIQVIDDYRYQRELTLQYRHRPGNSKDRYWECSVYRHCGRRQSYELSRGVAARLRDRLERQIREYPTLLFNDTGDNGRARHEGFVHLTELLLDGVKPSCTLL